MRFCGIGWICRQTLLDLLPDMIARLMSGLQELFGLIRNVLEVSNKSRAVFAGIQVLAQRGIINNAVRAGGKQVRQLLLKFTARQRSGVIRVPQGHSAASFRSPWEVVGSD